jgi:hypothetical protein
VLKAAARTVAGSQLNIAGVNYTYKAIGQGFSSGFERVSGSPLKSRIA